MKSVKILTGEPIVEVIASTRLETIGLERMADWVRDRRPECIPDGEDGRRLTLLELLPHGGTRGNGNTISWENLTDAELLVEIAGRKCYDSWGKKAGQRSNAGYIANTQSGEIPHASITYHPKMTFFIAGVSRRVSHELIRNYVGSDRDEEGSPSQESTRYTRFHGHYIEHPFVMNCGGIAERHFRNAMQSNFDAYNEYVDGQEELYEREHGELPKGMDRKRIYESASSYLSHSAETSWVWTTNATAMLKLLKERGNVAADLEFQRLARKWAAVCVGHWPNLFQQDWVRELAAQS